MLCNHLHHPYPELFCSFKTEALCPLNSNFSSHPPSTFWKGRIPGFWTPSPAPSVPSIGCSDLSPPNPHFAIQPSEFPLADLLSQLIMKRERFSSLASCHLCFLQWSWAFSGGLSRGSWRSHWEKPLPSWPSRSSQVLSRLGCSGTFCVYKDGDCKVKQKTDCLLSTLQAPGVMLCLPQRGHNGRGQLGKGRADLVSLLL